MAAPNVSSLGGQYYTDATREQGRRINEKFIVGIQRKQYRGQLDCRMFARGKIGGSIHGE
jgi:hypothetical protein